jgi:PAS domain S-box-containing protein
MEVRNKLIDEGKYLTMEFTSVTDQAHPTAVIKNERDFEPFPSAGKPWKVLIVDDLKAVHSLIRSYISNFVFEGRKLELLNAHSVEEAKIRLKAHPDIAVVLLDVVMEREDSGLLLARYIREVQGNRAVRIVLMTAQSALAPQEKVLVDYDINDYAGKVDLTPQKLFKVLIAAIRSYRDIMESMELSRRLREEIAERRAVEEKLRSSEEMYSSIFSHIGIGIAVINPEMEIVFMNPVMERLNPRIDLSERPVCYRSFNVPPREEVCSYCPTVLTLRDGQVHRAVTDTPTPQGLRNFLIISTPIFAGDGSVSAVVEAVEDITQRKRAYEELRQKETYLQGILEATEDGILAVDDEGTVIMSNRRFAELWRIPKEMIDAKDFNVLLEYVLEQLEEPDAFLIKVNALYGTDSTAEDTLLFRDGRILERSSAPLLQEGAIIGRVCSFRDVTAKRKLEDEVVHSQKLESVGLLAGGIAHDFNNLLTAVLGNISLAKIQLPQDHKSHSRLKEAEKAAIRARDLTQQFLTFAKGGAPVRRSASIVELIRETVGFVLSGSNVRCDFDMSEDINLVEIDEGQISQVIQNLIINADQAMPLGGVLKVFCRETVLREGEVAQLKEGRYIRISVSDQGVGISPEHLQKIFDPYFTTKEKGRGLGLASAYSIIRNHEGHISVSSRQGQGTTFTIHIPVISDSKGVKTVDDGKIVIGSGRVLVMDDEEAVLEVAAAILSYLGYEPVCAKNGIDALELYRKEREVGDPFAVVIADLTIPGGMGGKEMLEQLREADHGAKVIVSSGYNNDPIMSEYQSHGFSGVISKPYQVEEVSHVLARVIGG